MNQFYALSNGAVFYFSAVWTYFYIFLDASALHLTLSVSCFKLIVGWLVTLSDSEQLLGAMVAIVKLFPS